MLPHVLIWLSSRSDDNHHLFNDEAEIEPALFVVSRRNLKPTCACMVGRNAGRHVKWGTIHKGAISNNVGKLLRPIEFAKLGRHWLISSRLKHEGPRRGHCSLGAFSALDRRL
jgi:hypothetical protein